MPASHQTPQTNGSMIPRRGDGKLRHVSRKSRKGKRY